MGNKILFKINCASCGEGLESFMIENKRGETETKIFVELCEKCTRELVTFRNLWKSMQDLSEMKL